MSHQDVINYHILKGLDLIKSMINQGNNMLNGIKVESLVAPSLRANVSIVGTLGCFTQP